MRKLIILFVFGFIIFSTMTSCEKEGFGTLIVKTCVVPSDNDEDLLSGYFMKSQRYEVYIMIQKITKNKEEEIKKLQSIGVFTFPNLYDQNFESNPNRYIEINCGNDIPTGKDYTVSILLQKTVSSGSQNLNGYSKTFDVAKITNGQQTIIKVDCDEY